jgi:2-polyprenyl-6-methoxyphenol hydroxylase-like FAD-dependent oxidoreductase
MGTNSFNTDVIIVGAGPTGLMAANQLARHGIDFIIIDSKSGPTIQSRAILVTSRSLEIYQQMGISDSAVEGGAKINSFNIYSEGKHKVEVKIGEIGKGMTDFHFLLGFEQSKNEELLYANLKKQSKEVNWNTEFISLEQGPNGVKVNARKDNENLIFSGKYIIACDGARSPIRHQLKFRFDGGTYENKFFVADVVMDWDLTYDKLIVSPGDKNLCAFFPLKGERCYRVLGTLPKEYFNKEDITFDDLQKVILETWARKVHFEKVNWFSVYKLHHRCVNRFDAGRVFLAGDAAHIHSPAGGQGMNTGLQDAYNITWKLSMVIKGTAKEELLETYNEERLPFAQWLMKFTDRGFTMMTSSNPMIRFMRKHIGLNIIGSVMQMNSLRPIIFRTVSQTWYSYNRKSLSAKEQSIQKLKFKTGDRLPFIGDKYYEAFSSPSFHLIHISDQNKSNSDLGNLFPFPVKTIENNISQWKSFGVNSELYILVRPDNYIALICDQLNEEIAKKYWRRYFLK